MVISDFLNARDAMQRLILQPMPLATAYAVYKLAERFDNVLFGYAQNAVDAESAEAEGKKQIEFFEPLQISMLTPGITLSPCDIKALRPFIEVRAE